MSIVQCPHCKSLVEILEINCQIFRHGAFKLTGQQIPPHLPELECRRLAENNLIYGCGKPFKYDGKNVETCGYV
jgi:hypothetical protein